jgi:hypothetical protein
MSFAVSTRRGGRVILFDNVNWNDRSSIRDKRDGDMFHVTCHVFTSCSFVLHTVGDGARSENEGATLPYSSCAQVWVLLSR